MSIEIETNGREVEAEVRARIEGLRVANGRARMNAAIGKRVEIELRRYFASRPNNKKGWRSQGFWRKRIRNATQLTAYNAEGATITIADPAMNQKIYGGTIKPKEAKFLTIPARPEAAGRSPRHFNLAFIPLTDFRQARGGGKLVGLLVEKGESGTLKRTRGASRDGKRKTRLKVFYYCVASVYQAPDRNALPDAAQIDRGIEHETHTFVQRELKREGFR